MTSFLWIEGLHAGDAATPSPDWSVVDSYSFALERGEIVVGVEEESESKKKPLIRLASIEKEADSHTASIAQWHVDHQERRFRKMVLAECDLGFDPYMVITMENALLVGYALGASAGMGGADSDEKMSVEFTKVEFKFRSMDAASRFNKFRTFKFDDAAS